MSDILFATSYYLRFDPKQQRLMKPYPPLATLYAASIIRQAGFHVALFDAMFATGEADFLSALKKFRPAVVVLYEDSFNWLSKMCLERMRRAALTMAEAAKRFGAIVVAAGPDASDVPEVYLEYAQAVIIGEGEQTLEAVIRKLNADGEASNLTQIPGLALHDHAGKVVRTAAREPISDLDLLPRPAWDLVEMSAYRRAWKQRHGYFSLNQITTRGCPFRCNWCAKPVYGDSYHTRSPENLIEELLFIKREYHPDHLWYADDILGLKKAWLLRFSELASHTQGQTPFMCQTRVDLMTESNVAALKQAGCVEVWVGAESGAQTILDAMDKGTRVEQIGFAAKRLKAAGIRVAFFIQLGYPGEGWDEIRATRELILDCMPDEIGISVSYPLPGTRFYDRVKNQVEHKTRWQDSDDLDPLFPGTFSREFYQILHRMIHAEFQVHRGLLAARELVSNPRSHRREHLRTLATTPLQIGRFIKHRFDAELELRRSMLEQFAAAEKEV